MIAATTVRQLSSTLTALEVTMQSLVSLNQYHQIRRECAETLSQNGIDAESHVVMVRTPSRFGPGLLFWETDRTSKAQLLTPRFSGRRPNVLDFENPFLQPIQLLSLFWFTDNVPPVSVDFKALPDPKPDEVTKIRRKIPPHYANRLLHRLFQGNLSRRRKRHEEEDLFWIHAARELGYRYLIEPSSTPLSKEELFEILNRPLDQIRFAPGRLNGRTQNVLRGHGIFCLGQLVQLQATKMMEWSNFGMKGVGHIEDYLVSQGLQLGMDVGDWKPAI